MKTLDLTALFAETDTTAGLLHDFRKAHFIL
jgi:hypothetical protein